MTAGGCRLQFTLERSCAKNHSLKNWRKKEIRIRKKSKQNLSAAGEKLCQEYWQLPELDTNTDIQMWTQIVTKIQSQIQLVELQSTDYWREVEPRNIDDYRQVGAWYKYIQTRSLGALRAPTSSWRPFGPLDLVLRALRALRPVRLPAPPYIPFFFIFLISFHILEI